MEEAEPAARKDATPPPTDAVRLWARYQLPKGRQRPTDRLPVGRYDWNLLILRLDIPTHVKAIANALSTLCKADGSNVITTDPCLPAAFGINERQLRRHVAVLHDLKLLEVIEQPGGRGVTKTVDEKRRVRNAIVCQLTEPVDGKLPYRLDADFLPIEQREPGVAPLKAIEASKAARARNTGSQGAAVSGTPERNSGSPATGATMKHRQPDYHSKNGIAVAGLPQQDQNTGSDATDVSGSATWKQRHPDYRGNEEAPVDALPGQAQNPGIPATAATVPDYENTGSAATAVANATHGNPGPPATAATPVDDEKPRQPGYRGSPETPVAGLPIPRYPGYRSNENSGTPATGAASREEVLKNPTTKNPLNPTTRVVQLGGELTSGPADDDETPIDPSLAADDDPAEPPALDASPLDVEPPADWDRLAAAASFQPTEDPEYDDARRLVATIPPEDHLELFGNAQAELEAEYGERAGSYDSAGTYTADHHQIIVRAAEIWRRIQAAGHAPATEGTEGTES